MIAAFFAETTKLFHATLVRTTTLAVVLGIALMCSLLMSVDPNADALLAAKVGPFIAHGGWDGYLAAAAQVTAAGGMLGVGVVLGWVFGREFADGTITGLFAIPVTRPAIATAKFLAFALWSVVTSLALGAVLVLCGLAFGLGPPPGDFLPALARQLLLLPLSAAVLTPVAWVATLGRSVIAGIGCTIGIVVLAQVAVLTGPGAWLTFAAPGLWAVNGGHGVSATQFLLIIPVALAGAGLTIRAWARLQLDR